MFAVYRRRTTGIEAPFMPGSWSWRARIIVLLGWCAAGTHLTACRQGSDAPSPSQAASAPAAVQEQPGRTVIDAKNLTLQELVDDADQIFLGVVRGIEVRDETLTEDGESVTAAVRTVTLDVKEGVKNTSNARPVTIRQLVAVSTPLEIGDEVMWFLAGTSSLGLTQPLGVFSGDFRVEKSPDGTKVVSNLRGNEGLWEGSLWTGDGFDRVSVLATAREMGLPQQRRLALERSATVDPDRNQTIPLDLLLAATKSQVNRPND